MHYKLKREALAVIVSVVVAVASVAAAVYEALEARGVKASTTTIYITRTSVESSQLTTTLTRTVYSTITYTVTRNYTLTVSETARPAQSLVKLMPPPNFSLTLAGNLTFIAPTYDVPSETPGFSTVASPFLWNLLSDSSGQANMTFSDGVLQVQLNFTGFVRSNKATPVDGYPTLMYGAEYWWPFYGASSTRPPLALPISLNLMPQFNSTLGFSVAKEVGEVIDFSYDIWVGYVNGSGAWTVNSTEVVFPDMEIMVWLYHEGSLSGNPYFIYEGSLTVPVTVNGTSEREQFYVYVLPHTGSSSGWIGVYYLSASNLTGNVTVPLSLLIKEAPYFARDVFPWINVNNYYLDAIQVGMEFSDTNGTVVASYRLWEWDLSFNG